MCLNQDLNLRTGSPRPDSLAQDRCAFANLFAGDWLPDREHGPSPSNFEDLITYWHLSTLNICDSCRLQQYYNTQGLVKY